MSRFTLHHGDSREILKTLAESSVDSIVCDPPYHLTTGKKGGSGEASVNQNSPAGRSMIGTGFMGMTWDGGDVAHDVSLWAECLRVLKPGGHLLAFSGTRTYHRMVCAIEDAGFEIRDQIGWVYGSGFPKSLDVSKAIDKAAGAEREVVGVSPFASKASAVDLGRMNDDAWVGGADRSITAPATDAAKQWQGWGTALKPAWEPICMARKPLIGTVAANVLAHGTGALNIDECRIAGAKPATTRGTSGDGWGMEAQGRVEDDGLGRWPANLIHDGSDEVVACFPDAPGQQADISYTAPSDKTAGIYGRMRREGEPSADSSNEGAVGFKMKPGARRLDEGSAARFFYAAKTSREDRNEGCEHFARKPLNWSSGTQNPGSFQAEGTDRTSPNHHPTVKPTDLMRYLCRLVTPKGGIVLDPFVGSGSTGKAAMLEGFDFIGVDLSAEYLEIARARIDFALRQGHQPSLLEAA